MPRSFCFYCKKDAKCKTPLNARWQCISFDPNWRYYAFFVPYKFIVKILHLKVVDNRLI